MNTKHSQRLYMRHTQFAVDWMNFSFPPAVFV